MPLSSSIPNMNDPSSSETIPPRSVPSGSLNCTPAETPFLQAFHSQSGREGEMRSRCAPCLHRQARSSTANAHRSLAGDHCGYLPGCFLPLFFQGAASLADDILDLCMAGVLSYLLGWHWEFLPSFLVKLMPRVDLVPLWTLAVANVYRKSKRLGVIQRRGAEENQRETDVRKS